MPSGSDQRLISVVSPVFNEQENLPELLRRVMAALNSIGQPSQYAWEYILVDDGSSDQSPRLIREAHAADARIKGLRLSRNFGHQPAITAGIRAAAGDCVILIDADLQDPPEVIPELVKQWQQGSQVVIAQRASRAERGPRGWALRMFYPLLRRVTDLPAAPNAGIFGLMDRAVVDVFNTLPERNRYIPGLRSWLGFRQSAVTYDRQERSAGKPKQTLRRLLHYAADAMVSFSYKPLRAATWLGFLVSLVAFALGVFYFVTYFAWHKQFTGFTTTIVCVLFLGGVQLVSVGIMGEYVGRIYEEVKQRPLFVVEERIGFGE